jgi:hypothetical protein
MLKRLTFLTEGTRFDEIHTSLNKQILNKAELSFNENLVQSQSRNCQKYLKNLINMTLLAKQVRLGIDTA